MIKREYTSITNEMIEKLSLEEFNKYQTDTYFRGYEDGFKRAFSIIRKELIAELGSSGALETIGLPKLEN